MNKYNRSEIMRKAWRIRKASRNLMTLSECLRRAWGSAKSKNNKPIEPDNRWNRLVAKEEYFRSIERDQAIEDYYYNVELAGYCY